MTIDPTAATRGGRLRRCVGGLVAVVLVSLGSACSGSDSGAHGSAGGQKLVGLFRLTPGSGTASGGDVHGTWFRMLQPNGSITGGPYMVNADSPADGGKATLLRPGSSGGLRTGGYQSQPALAFDGGGNSLAAAIIAPTRFFGVRFSVSTNETDPQTRTEIPPPTVEVKDGRLTADLSSWAASWNRQNFNQGAPKPVTSTGAKAPGQQQVQRAFDYVSRTYLDAAPKQTRTGDGATGTYDSATRHFMLQWTSAIVGGPFNGFTGLWHLEGVFTPGSAGPES